MCNQESSKLDITNVKIYVPSPEISERVQKKLFEMGCSWWHLERHVKWVNDTKWLFIDNELLLTRTGDVDWGRNHRNRELKWQDLLNEGGFRVGDKVRAFGVDGVITNDDHCDSMRYVFPDSKPLLVEFGSKHQWFMRDGRVAIWHKEPSLILISRPPRTVKRKFYQYIYRHRNHTNGEQSAWKFFDTLLDESCTGTDGKKHLDGNKFEHKRIEESCQEIEV